MKHPTAFEKCSIRRQDLEIVQINLGNRCNQQCAHCHVKGGLGGTSMDRHTALMILAKLAELSVRSIEFTGGAPELNPHLPFFIKQLARQKKDITVRTNLTVLALADYAGFFDLYQTHKVKLVASLPCYLPENVDRQRGQGVFDKSITVLRRLNNLGYGSDGLDLDLVYNPLADVLPPDQNVLELGYRRALHDLGVTFNNIIAITNVPIGRFKESLTAQNAYGRYIHLLQQSFNAATCDRLMCRRLVSVDYHGFVHDCDFNLALGRKIRSIEDKKFWEINFSCFTPEITFDRHCLACTAGSGSSCHGALVVDERPAHKPRTVSTPLLRID